MSFDELSEKVASFTVHHCDIRILAIEICKNLSEKTFSDLFIR